MNDWLPEHQRHVLFTLAHIDSVLEQLASTLYDYLREPDLWSLRTTARTGMKMCGSKPLPLLPRRSRGSPPTR